MSDEQAIHIANFISDLRAAIDKHAEEAGRALSKIVIDDGVIRKPDPSDQMWAIFLAFHTAAVDWVIAQGIREDKVPACVMVDVGLRMFLDNTRDTIMKVEAEKRKPKPNIIGLRN
ncbi:hypothetical protein [Bradyrhizobium sp. sGM-13]|uniref:hypothetical protein n=1 Tax=Bradyrhizobium sp. sGM-13 TaxID=2831781 RepID=UPI001BCAA0F7|nr:hypothetical protein [Bradyrhizobium sp. sGM-13]